MKPHTLTTVYAVKYIWIRQCPIYCKQTVSALTGVRDAQDDLGLRWPCMPRRHIFPWVCYIQPEKSPSLLMIEQCSLVLNSVMPSRFHGQEWLNTCRRDIETPISQKHVRSDFGPFEAHIS